MAQSAQIAKVNWWHQRLADWLLSNPEKQLKDAAREFNVSQSWLSVVKNSDAFMDHFARLSAEHSSVLSLGIRDKLVGVADQALTAMSERLESQGATMPMNQLIDTAELALKRAGFGEPRSVTNIGQVNNLGGGVSKAELQSYRDKMREVNGGPPVELKVIEGEKTEAGTSPAAPDAA